MTCNKAKCFTCSDLFEPKTEKEKNSPLYEFDIADQLKYLCFTEFSSSSACHDEILIESVHCDLIAKSKARTIDLLVYISLHVWSCTLI